MARFHIAQANIARIAHEGIEAPQMADFVAKLAPVNELAERSPGYVWRLKDEAGNDATSVPVFDGDPRVIINMSVWQSLDHLFEFAYKTVHAKLIRDRQKWFEPVEGIANMALWWIAEGHEPTVEESITRMRRLTEVGPSPEAFVFSLPFDADGRPFVRQWPEKDCA